MSISDDIARIMRELAENDARRDRMAAEGAEWSPEDIDRFADQIKKDQPS